ncbi:MAG: hypothetical protein R6V52_09890 [Bacteroidales bacterium]
MKQSGLISNSNFLFCIGGLGTQNVAACNFIENDHLVDIVDGVLGPGGEYNSHSSSIALLNHLPEVADDSGYFLNTGLPVSDPEIFLKYRNPSVYIRIDRVFSYSTNRINPTENRTFTEEDSGLLQQYRGYFGCKAKDLCCSVVGITEPESKQIFLCSTPGSVTDAIENKNNQRAKLPEQDIHLIDTALHNNHHLIIRFLSRNQQGCSLSPCNCLVYGS